MGGGGRVWCIDLRATPYCTARCRPCAHSEPVRKRSQQQLVPPRDEFHPSPGSRITCGRAWILPAARRPPARLRVSHTKNGRGTQTKRLSCHRTHNRFQSGLAWLDCQPLAPVCERDCSTRTVLYELCVKTRGDISRPNLSTLTFPASFTRKRLQLPHLDAEPVPTKQVVPQASPRATRRLATIRCGSLAMCLRVLCGHVLHICCLA